MGLANDYNNRAPKQGPAIYSTYSRPKSKVYEETLQHIWNLRLNTRPSGIDKRYDRSMRLMRYSQLLLHILEEPMETIDNLTRLNPLQMVVRAMRVGRVKRIHKECSGLPELRRFASSGRYKSAVKTNRLPNAVGNLSNEKFQQTSRQISSSAQRYTTAVHGAARPDRSIVGEESWDYADTEAHRLRLLSDDRRNTFGPFLTLPRASQLFEIDFASYGVGPFDTKVGDVIYAFWEMKNPTYVLLRRDENMNDQVYRVVGKVAMLGRVSVFNYDDHVTVIRMGIDIVRWLSY